MIRNLTYREFLDLLQVSQSMIEGVWQVKFEDAVLGEIDLKSMGSVETRQKVLAEFKIEMARMHSPHTRTVLLETKCGCTQQIDLPTHTNTWRIPLRSRQSVFKSASDPTFQPPAIREFVYRGQHEHSSGIRILVEA